MSGQRLGPRCINAVPIPNLEGRRRGLSGDHPQEGQLLAIRRRANCWRPEETDCLRHKVNNPPLLWLGAPRKI